MFKLLFLISLIITNLFSEIKNELFILPSQNKEINEKIENLIDSSQNEIIIAMYNFSHKDILKKLKKSSKKGVKILLILDEEKYKENKKLIKELEEENIKIVIPKDKMHMKVAIFDNKFLLIGSMNWTKESFEENHEIVIINNDLETIIKLSSYFKNSKF